jgi:hypothetical protein
MCVALSIRAAALVVLCALLTPQLQAADSPESRPLETLLSPQSSDEEWQRAAEVFRELPADAAIRALYPEIAKGVPNGMPYTAYNCSDPSRDRHLGRWGRYCVTGWLWRQTISCGRKYANLSRTLLELWAQPQSVYGQSVLLSALDYYAWVPEAEDPVRTLFRDSEASIGLRAQAAGCLLRHFGTKYQRDVIQFALFSSREIRDVLFRLLAAPSSTRISGADPAVVRMGFWLMFEELAENEDRFAHRRAGGSYYGAFLSANALATYLGEGFTPDYRLPKYQAEEGKELWYRDTTENALSWWLKNKERYAN